MNILQLPDLDVSTFRNFKKVQLLYWTIIVMICSASISLQFIYVDISVNAIGVVRPANERTPIRAMIPGVIENIFYREGDYVPKDSIILTLQNNITMPKLLSLNSDIAEKQSYIHDLETLTSDLAIKSPTRIFPASLVYRRQLMRYIYQLNEQQASLSKVEKELSTDSSLHAQQVISHKEYFDKSIEAQKLRASIAIIRGEQMSAWQEQLSDLKSELSQLLAEKALSTQQANNYEVRAPVAGTLQGLSTRYEGGVIAAGDAICELSPESQLVAECMVQSNDIGLLRLNQRTVFHFDAFDHNYFGTVKGKILSIDNDYTIIENLPVFKVRCQLDRNNLELRNGFIGKVKKGLTVHARFLVTRRRLSQLLFDKIDDWLNPVAH
jgi:membrane fusion protein, peptide pheromone/bacteriocin exporter